MRRRATNPSRSRCSRAQATSSWSNGERVEVYDDATTFLAAADAARISPDGTTFRTASARWVVRQPPWTGSPHFYASGRLIVQYIGTHQDVTVTLARALGHRSPAASPDDSIRLARYLNAR